MKKIKQRFGTYLRHVIVEMLVRMPWAERLLLGVLRPFRRQPLARRLWSGLRFRLQARLGGTKAALRWVRLPGGPGMYVDLADLLSCLYWERDLYEPLTTVFFLQKIEAGWTVVDVGANFGYFTLQAAQCVGSGGRVVAFEANPGVREVLSRSVRLNGWTKRVRIADCALAGEPGVLPLYLSKDPGLSGIASFVPWKGHLESGNLSMDVSVKVRAERFDDWVIAEPLQRLDAVKIDVEGAEMSVLKGMEKSLRAFRPKFVIVETTLHGAVRDFMERLGYDAKPLEYHVREKEWGNILFAARDGAVEGGGGA